MCKADYFIKESLSSNSGSVAKLHLWLKENRRSAMLFLFIVELSMECKRESEGLAYLKAYLPPRHEA